MLSVDVSVVGCTLWCMTQKTSSEHDRPMHRDRPELPEGYGTPADDQGLLRWPVVEQRLRDAVHYWLASTRPDGRPHVVPRWGIWLDDRFYYDGSPQTVHVQNLQHNSACAVHVGEGADAIIVEGHSRASDPVGEELGERISLEMNRKYSTLGYTTTSQSWSGADAGGLRVLHPSKALAWFDFPADVTRFRF